jgi:DNA-binding HxlR family transcriptional regulator
MTEALNKAIISRMAELLGDKWAIPIIGELLNGSRRFGELQSALAVNPRTLANRLKRLEAAEFVIRQVYAEVPPRVEYRLTDKGHDLSAILRAISDFGEKYLTPESPTETSLTR